MISMRYNYIKGQDKQCCTFVRIASIRELSHLLLRIKNPCMSELRYAFPRRTGKAHAGNKTRRSDNLPETRGSFDPKLGKREPHSTQTLNPKLFEHFAVNV